MGFPDDTHMPLSLAQLQDIQNDAMADDIEIDLEKMSLWTEGEARTYFESGGATEPPLPRVAVTAPYTRGSRPTNATPWLSCLEKKPAAKYRVVVFSLTDAGPRCTGVRGLSPGPRDTHEG